MMRKMGRRAALRRLACTCCVAVAGALIVGQASAPAAAGGGFRAVCGIGQGHTGGWCGPVRNTYSEAAADANWHNAGGGHGAYVVTYLG
jgi:hypothetical protein